MPDQMSDDLHKISKAIAAKAFVKPNGPADGKPVDVGAENIDRAGELMGQTLRDIFLEGAKRARAAGQAAVERGQQTAATMETLALKCESYAAAACATVEQETMLARDLATGAADLIAMIGGRQQ
jgi:hypothetical protein